MTGANESGNTRRTETLLDSTLESVDSAESLVIDVATEMGFDEEAVHKLGMAVRESMVNAVVHGNRYSANKKVHLGVESSERGITIVIGDEGEGFDPATLPDPLAEENLLRQSGRGILLIRAFVDQFEITRRAPHGMEFRLTKFKNQE